jgi:iron complex transport system substrate-binding protein
MKMVKRIKKVSGSIMLAVVAVITGLLLHTAVLAADVATGGRRVIIDDVGREIVLDKPLERVVVFNKFNSEIIRAIGRTDAIAGTDRGTLQDDTYWPGWDDSMLAGNSQTDIDYEKVASLRPDAVILPKNGSYEECEVKLTPFGIKVIVVTGWENNEYAKQIEIIGRAFGEEAEAKEYSDFCKAQVDLLKRKLADVWGLKTVYLENSGEYKTCLHGSGWNDMISMAGGKNIFGDIDIAKEDQARGNVHSFSVEPEAIVSRNPDAVLLNAYDSMAISGTSVYVPPSREAANQALSDMANRPGWSSMNAVKGGRFYGISSFAGNGCFKIVGATYLAKFLYPDEMAGVEPDVFFSDWLQKYQGMEFQDGHAIAMETTGK